MVVVVLLDLLQAVVPVPFGKLNGLVCTSVSSEAIWDSFGSVLRSRERVLSYYVTYVNVGAACSAPIRKSGGRTFSRHVRELDACSDFVQLQMESIHSVNWVLVTWHDVSKVELASDFNETFLAA